MKLDTDTKTIIKSLVEDEIYFPREKSIDISKFLDEDLTVDLWLLEMATRNCIRFMKHYLGNSGTSPYLFLRNYEDKYRQMRNIIPGSPKDMEELSFIVRFKDKIASDELS